MNPDTRAEQVAAEFLLRHGLKLLQTNYRCRFGEFDLILKDGETLVFAKVLKRGRSDFGGASRQYRRTQATSPYPYRAAFPCFFTPTSPLPF